MARAASVFSARGRGSPRYVQFKVRKTEKMKNMNVPRSGWDAKKMSLSKTGASLTAGIRVHADDRD